MVTACTSVADHALGLPEVGAFAHPANAGSRRVLEKAGFEVVRLVPKWTASFTGYIVGSNSQQHSAG